MMTSVWEMLHEDIQGSRQILQKWFQPLWFNSLQDRNLVSWVNLWYARLKWLLMTRYMYSRLPVACTTNGSQSPWHQVKHLSVTKREDILIAVAMPFFTQKIFMQVEIISVAFESITSESKSSSCSRHQSVSPSLSPFESKSQLSSSPIVHI